MYSYYVLFKNPENTNNASTNNREQTYVILSQEKINCQVTY